MKDQDERQIDKKCMERYTKEASFYDQRRYLDWKGRFVEEHIHSLLRELFSDGKDKKRLLDVATGTGRAGLILAQEGWLVVGIDLVPAMLDEARKKAKKLNLSNISFIGANARELPFENDYFDIVICLRFFHFIPYNLRRPIIEEMLRVLKPEGILLLEFVNPFYGLIGALYRRWLTKGRPFYLWPTQRRSLFAGAKVIKTVGTYFPLAQRIARVNLRCGRWLLHLCRYFPFKHLSSEKWYLLRKNI
jgi:ubiquinone/menaquinone biosynthesis C-methylase UbiE